MLRMQMLGLENKCQGILEDIYLERNAHASTVQQRQGAFGVTNSRPCALQEHLACGQGWGTSVRSKSEWAEKSALMQRIHCTQLLKTSVLFFRQNSNIASCLGKKQAVC
jgi:hypothetical protein